MQKRAPGTPAASAAYRLDNTPTYFCDVWAESKPIPDQLRGNADAVLNMDRDATEFLSQQALIRREKIFAANLFAAGKWGTDVAGKAAAPGAGEFLQWNDGASSPIEDIRTGKLAIKQATGYPANTLVISEPVWLKLVDHPDLVDRVKYGQTNGGPARITREALAAILEIDRILVMGSIENTADEGLAASHSFIGGKNALLCHVAPNPGLLTPSAAYTFGWTGYLGAGNEGNRIKRYPVGDHRQRHRGDRDGLRHQARRYGTRVLLQGRDRVSRCSMAYRSLPKFNPEGRFIVNRPFLFKGQTLQPGELVEGIPTRRLRQLFELRHVAAAPPHRSTRRRRTPPERGKGKCPNRFRRSSRSRSTET